MPADARRLTSSGSPCEPLIGFSRAARASDWLMEIEADAVILDE